jgi:multidrug resistance protein, MATE family
MKTTYARCKDILVIAWPLIIANSFWNLQLTIDRVFLGNFSTEALGAAMAVMGVFWVPMALLQQTAGYLTTFVAQYYGADEHSKIGSCLWQALYVSAVGGIALLGLNFISPWFFAQVGHATSVQALEVEYFNAVNYSALPTAIVAAASGFFTGLGDTRKVTLINLVGLILNVFFDYTMIFGNWCFPAMGVAGAGYATAIATYGAAAFGLILVFQHRYNATYRTLTDWRPNLALMGKFLRFGVPSGMQWALEGLAFTVFLIIMGNIPGGEAALASSSIAVTIMMLSVLPSMGVAQAVLTLVGQRLGEGKPDEAAQTTWDGVRITILYMSLIASTFATIPEFYLSWFRNESNPELWAQVKAMVPHLLKIVAIFTIFDSMYLNISFALKGAGDTRIVSLIALIVPWPTMVLPTYLLRHNADAVYWGWGFAAVYAISVTLILVLRFRGGKWKSMSVIH